MTDEAAVMAQKLGSLNPEPEALLDLTLKDLLIRTPLAFHSYVNHRIWGIGTHESKFSAERLGKVIDKFELSGKILGKLEKTIKEGIKANPDYYLFDYKSFNYFLHLFDAKNDLMLVARKPITEENYCFRDILDPTYTTGNMKPKTEEKEEEKDEKWRPVNGVYYGLPRHYSSRRERIKADKIIETAMKTAGIPTVPATPALKDSKNVF
jgi:hypothetical protein